MNLILDQGNSFTKAGIFQRNELVWFESFSSSQHKLPGYILEQSKNITAAIISSVKADASQLLKQTERIANKCIYLNHDTPLPLKIHYKTKNTLGYDRIADAVGANNIYSNTNVLVIDAGTALKFEFINEMNEYLGGNISPGLSMRYKALHTFTDKLPLLSPGEEKIKSFGQSTSEAINGGIIGGITMEIKGYIDEIYQNYSNVKVILTGGDAKFFEKRLKNSIFVVSNLSLLGLNAILEYNVKNS